MYLHTREENIPVFGKFKTKRQKQSSIFKKGIAGHGLTLGTLLSTNTSSRYLLWSGGGGILRVGLR